MTISIEVTQADIERGLRAHFYRRPLALAAARHFREVAVMRLERYGELLLLVRREKDGPSRFRWAVPQLCPEGRVFLREFEAGGSVQPFTCGLTFADDDFRVLRFPAIPPGSTQG